MLKSLLFAAVAAANSRGTVEEINAARAARLAEHKKISAEFDAAVKKSKKEREVKDHAMEIRRRLGYA